MPLQPSVGSDSGLWNETEISDAIEEVKQNNPQSELYDNKMLRAYALQLLNERREHNIQFPAEEIASYGTYNDADISISSNQIFTEVQNIINKNPNVKTIEPKGRLRIEAIRNIKENNKPKSRIQLQEKAYDKKINDEIARREKIDTAFAEYDQEQKIKIVEDDFIKLKAAEDLQQQQKIINDDIEGEIRKIKADNPNTVYGEKEVRQLAEENIKLRPSVSINSPQEPEIINLTPLPINVPVPVNPPLEKSEELKQINDDGRDLKSIKLTDNDLEKMYMLYNEKFEPYIDSKTGAKTFGFLSKDNIIQLKKIITESNVKEKISRIEKTPKKLPTLKTITNDNRFTLAKYRDEPIILIDIVGSTEKKIIL